MENETITPPIQTPTVVYVQPQGSGRIALMVLLSTAIGFAMPVIACGFLMFITFLSFATLGSAVPTGAGSGPVSTGTGDAVAIIRVEGTITSGEADEFVDGTAVSGVVISDLRAAEADPTIKAIVLLVDSPGGTVTGSKEIYEVIKEINKPIVVSMGALAASGGYYISAPANYILARSDTWTGSIGVISQVITAEELLNEVGVDVVIITSGENKSIGSPFREMTPEQIAIFQALVDESFAEFVQVIVEGRGLSESVVRELADGRIYSGRQAVTNGLVDALGTLQDAVAKAAALGGISGTPRIVEYEHVPSFSALLTGFSAQANRSEAEQLLQMIQTLTLPTQEYRFVGPTIGSGQ
ncbi:MAG: signal peptide peptidase SppA [Chloroflexi bacterium]|nr:signal peptide peptidase SppA [Chloroflexota bacterium]MBP8056474.1 signal peptide peptidase SppA [Chloroflexota bacterium]